MSEEPGGLTDEQHWQAEAAYHADEAEAAYAELLARGEDTDEAVIDLLEAFPLPTRAEGFVIDGDGKADWAIRRIGEAEARMRRDAATVLAETERWEAWQAKRNEQNQATIDRMQSLLSAYYDQLKAEGLLPRKSKSYRLPHGVLQARTHAIKWVIVDPVKLLAWAKGVTSAVLVRTKEEPAWSDIVKRLVPEAAEIGAGAVDTTTGELVPGVQVQELAKDEFQAKADLS